MHRAEDHGCRASRLSNARFLVPLWGHLDLQADPPEDPGRKVTGQGWGGPGEELAELRRQPADLQAKQEGAATVSRRLMAEINAFRAGTEATRAAYTAAEEAAKTVWHR